MLQKLVDLIEELVKAGLYSRPKSCKVLRPRIRDSSVIMQKCVLLQD